MEKYLLLILFAVSATLNAQPENPGPYFAGWTSVTLQREGRTLNCRIYYPALSEGSETAIDNLHGPYPVVAFGHGFLMQTSYYLSTFRHLATHGYVVIAPQFPDTQHELLAYDLNFCVSYIKDMNTNPAHRFYNNIDTGAVGVSGHSMGGGASLIAAVHDSTILVAAPFAAAETTTPVIPRMYLIKGAVYLISAQNDGITPVFSTQLPMYQNALPVKVLPVLRGANHIKFIDVSAFDWTDPGGYMSRTEQLRLARRLLTSVFGLFLKKDTSYFKYAFGNIIGSDTSVMMTRELKPLKPLDFNLENTPDTLYTSSVTLKWHSTHSLNQYDTVKYTVVIAEDSLFNNPVEVTGLISDTAAVVQRSSGTYFWKVRAQTSPTAYTYSSNSGKIIIASPSFAQEDISVVNNLYLECYPNPSAGNINIRCSAPDNDVPVKLSVFDLLGREVVLLHSSYLTSGYYETEFDPGKINAPSGIYFVRLSCGKNAISQKIVLAR